MNSILSEYSMNLNQVREDVVAAGGRDEDVTEIRQVWSRADHEKAPGAAHLDDGDADSAAFEASRQLGKPLLRLLLRKQAGGDTLMLKLYEHGNIAPLSRNLAILERFGLCVQHHQATSFKSEQGTLAVVHEFSLVSDHDTRIDEPALWPVIEGALNAGWGETSEHDALCSLVVRLGLRWRDIVLLRALSKYLKHIGVPVSARSAADAFAENPHVAQLILENFTAKFDPRLGKERAELLSLANGALQEALAKVVKATDERVLRKHAMLLGAILRTNFFQIDRKGLPKEYLSFKINAEAIDELPAPRPRFEIFVYSSWMEGIHLRGGRVSRGGIRWSDRQDDFRTEIHGLLKAQMVKNVVIVPEGSKGGFIIKRAPSDSSRDAVRRNAITCYETLIRGLLDLTDNIVDGQNVAPAEVVCHDEPDPYLVVAADKGTATFSDAANAISTEYGFWLDDAFASGGSVGYDHKKMGITARGAWESVKRHFAEIGKDVQKDPFTVVGIGDMSGDVFGNGMLLSTQIKLIGAFNHRHIFIDPNPAPQASFEERLRLFQLPDSSWADYNVLLLSPGGGIYDRSAKSIRVSEQAQTLLGLPSQDVSPNDIIKALLKASIDLLWLGGIGTYVKASTETHDQVGDRACDPIRINAADLRCKVIGEGANLGLTQQGRIEFALLGGRLNTDAIDNAGGVNCSDHEVNIKILLNSVERAGLLSRTERNGLLRDMTDEVASLVLRDNYLQSQALSVALSCAPEMLLRHQSLIRRFERAGQFDRAVAGLPNDEIIAQRKAAGLGLTRPELAVLLAHTKISLFREICNSNLPDDPLFAQELLDYFPTRLREQYQEHIQQHPLRREIVATMVVNSMVNRVGSGFVDQLQGQTGADDAAVARAYVAAREVFGLRRFWLAVEALDGKVPCPVQTTMHLESRRLAEVATLWIMQNVVAPDDLTRLTARFAESVSQLQHALGTTLDATALEHLTRRTVQYQEAGVPREIADWAAALPELHHALEIVALSQRLQVAVELVATLYFATREQLGITALLQAAGSMPQRDQWELQAIRSCLTTLTLAHNTLVASLAQRCGDTDAESAIAPLLSENAYLGERLFALRAELKSGRAATLAMLCVAAKDIATLAQVSACMPA